MNLTSPEGEEAVPASSNQPASSKVTNKMETTSPVEKPEEVYTRRLLVQAPSCAVPPLEVARVASEVHIQRPEHPTGPATPADIADSVRPGEGWSLPPFSSWCPGGPIPQGQQTEGLNHCRKSGGADNPSQPSEGRVVVFGNSGPCGNQDIIVMLRTQLILLFYNCKATCKYIR